MKNNHLKLPAFFNVSLKFYLNRLQNSRDISVLKYVEQAKFCLFYLFMNWRKLQP